MKTGKHGGTNKSRGLTLSTRVPVYLSAFSRPLLWFFPLAFLIIFFFLPLSRIFALSLDTSALTSVNLRIAYSALGFTFYQAALSTLLTLLLGLPAAYLFARYEFRGKSLLRAKR